MAFKPYPQEFLLTELEEAAASVGKTPEEVEFVFTEMEYEGVLGRVLSIAGEEPAAVPKPKARAKAKTDLSTT